ncbi:MAG: carbon-nitrogen hydrolase [Planctomycetota bacterium]
MRLKSPHTVTVALVQMTCSNDLNANVAKALDRVAEAARNGAQIVCLQELFRSPYFCQTEDDNCFALAETIPGPTSHALSDAAKKNGVVLVGSLFEKRADGLYHNTAVVFDKDGSLAGTYRKMHIPDDPCFYEKFYFTPGDADPGFKSINTSLGKIAVLVCWDQWYPEAARLAALSGAKILFYPTAIGWHPADDLETKRVQADAWETIQRSHAIANGCFVCSVNRVGPESNLQFWGNSFIADPFGKIVAKSATDSEAILMAECNLDQIDWTRRHWPFLRDRRVDAYGNLTRRYID